MAPMTPLPLPRRLSSVVRLPHVVTVLVALAGLYARPLPAQAPDASFTVVGPGGTRTVTARTLATVPRVEVKAAAHHVSGAYSGVPLAALLRQVGMPRSDSLRGLQLAAYVVAEGADGYRVTFAVAELDTTFTDREVLVVDRKDGAPLGAKDGPFQLIVPGEKRPARWVRQLRRVSYVMVPAGR